MLFTTFPILFLLLAGSTPSLESRSGPKDTIVMKFAPDGEIPVRGFGWGGRHGAKIWPEDILLRNAATTLKRMPPDAKVLSLVLEPTPADAEKIEKAQQSGRLFRQVRVKWSDPVSGKEMGIQLQDVTIKSVKSHPYFAVVFSARRIMISPSTR